MYTQINYAHHVISVALAPIPFLLVFFSFFGNHGSLSNLKPAAKLTTEIWLLGKSPSN